MTLLALLLVDGRFVDVVCVWCVLLCMYRLALVLVYDMAAWRWFIVLCDITNITPFVGQDPSYYILLFCALWCAAACVWQAPHFA